MSNDKDGEIKRPWDAAHFKELLQKSQELRTAHQDLIGATLELLGFDPLNPPRGHAVYEQEITDEVTLAITKGDPNDDSIVEFLFYTPDIDEYSGGLFEVFVRLNLVSGQAEDEQGLLLRPEAARQLTEAVEQLPAEST